MKNFKNILNVINIEYEYGRKLLGILEQIAVFIIINEIILSVHFIVTRPFFFNLKTFLNQNAIIFIALVISMSGIDLSMFYKTFTDKKLNIAENYIYDKLNNFELIIGISISCLLRYFFICLVPVAIVLYCSDNHFDALRISLLMLLIISNCFFYVSYDIYKIINFEKYSNDMRAINLQLLILGIFSVLFFIVNIYFIALCSATGSETIVNTNILNYCLLGAMAIQSIISLSLITISAQSENNFFESYKKYYYNNYMNDVWNSAEYTTFEKVKYSLYTFIKGLIDCVFYIFLLTSLELINILIYLIVFYNFFNGFSNNQIINILNFLVVLIQILITMKIVLYISKYYNEFMDRVMKINFNDKNE